MVPALSLPAQQLPNHLNPAVAHNKLLVVRQINSHVGCLNYSCCERDRDSPGHCQRGSMNSLIDEKLGNAHDASPRDIDSAPIDFAMSWRFADRIYSRQLRRLQTTWKRLGFMDEDVRLICRVRTRRL